MMAGNDLNDIAIEDVEAYDIIREETDSQAKKVLQELKAKVLSENDPDAIEAAKKKLKQFHYHLQDDRFVIPGKEPRDRRMLNNLMKRLPLQCVVRPSNLECTICLNDFQVGASVVLLRCLHIFHSPCIKGWMQQTHSCPTCRTQIFIYYN